MKTYWLNLTLRERMLVFTAGGLLALFIGVIGVVRPLMQYHDQSEQNLVAAQNELKVIAELSSEYRRAQNNEKNNNKPTEVGQAARVTISVSARDAGLVVSRIQPSEDGSLTLWSDSVASPVFYKWLKSLEANHGLAPNLVSLQKVDGSTLRVQVQFAGVS